MCRELCDANEDMCACHDCGRLICFDMESGDDVIAPAAVTSSGDLYCLSCAYKNEIAEEEEAEFAEPWEHELMLEDLGLLPEDTDAFKQPET